MLYSAYRPTPLGRILLAGDGERLTGLWFEGQKYFAASAGEPMTEKSDLPLFRLAGSWLDEYFHGQNPAIADLPLAPRGSVFRRAVWDILREIPYGELTTYGAIAAAGGPDGAEEHVRPGGGRGGGTQSHFDHHSLPPGGWN